MTFTPVPAALGRFRLAGAPPRGTPARLAAFWRGAVAGFFPGAPAFHGHDGDRLLYRYPPVHYRWADGAPELLALGPSARTVMDHPWPGTALRLGADTHTVAEVVWRTSVLALAPADRLVRYTFGAPWLALNQENHARYRGMSPGARRAELDRILVGNLLALCKGMEWFLPEGSTLFAAAEPRGEVDCEHKGTALTGFEGEFVCNLELPDALAVGRAVSHGYGWFRRVG